MSTSNKNNFNFGSFLDGRGVIFEKLISTEKDYPKCVFGTDYNRGFGLNIIRYEDNHTFLINCEQDDDSSGIRSIVMEEEDQFNHFIREDMFSLIYSMIKGSDIKFQIIVGGFAEDDKNWYGADDIKEVYKNFE